MTIAGKAKVKVKCEYSNRVRAAKPVPDWEQGTMLGMAMTIADKVKELDFTEDHNHKESNCRRPSKEITGTTLDWEVVTMSGMAMITAVVAKDTVVGT